MFAWWRNLPRERRQIWTIIGCAVAGVTAAKTGYFYVSRGMIVSDLDRRHKAAVEKLKESYEFADWSHREREKQLPDLTPEQRRQMNNYLGLMMEHEVKKRYPEEPRASTREQD